MQSRFLSGALSALRCPFGAEEFGLLEDKFRRFVLEIGWVAVFSEDAFN
jgi:hypothetical protein